MNIDLQHSLDDLARSVADDGTADRMSGRVNHMVGRIRRRRAARQAATGVAGAAGVTAIALVGAEITQPSANPAVPASRPAAPAAPAPDPADPAPDASADPAPPADPAVAAVDALTGATPSGVFPECGSVTPAPRTEAAVALDLALAPGGYAPGQRVAEIATVRATDGRSVLANADVDGARLVLARDGVVVGAVAHEPRDVMLLDLAAGEAETITLTGALDVCGTDGLGLPTGTYEAYAVLDVTLKEVVEASGEAVSSSESFVAVSAPVPVTIG